MKMIIPNEQFDAIKKRNRKELWSNFLIFIPISLVVALLLGYLNNQYPIIIIPIIFFFSLFAYWIRGLIGINFYASIFSQKYSVEIKGDLLIERQGGIRKEANLSKSTSYLNKFGMLIVNEKTDTLLNRILERKQLHIPPELEQFEKVRNIIESKILDSRIYE